MSSFSERQGHRAPRSVTQISELDAETRMAIWNVINGVRTFLGEKSRRFSSRTEDQVLAAIWAWEFKQAADEQPHDYKVWDAVKKHILTEQWFDVMDLVERIAVLLKAHENTYTNGITKAFLKACNELFETYLVGFRFVKSELTPIDSSVEASSVSKAIEDAATIVGARHHLERAVELLADRSNPDYPNSIKESISAVEAVCGAVTGEKTLGAAIKKLEAAGVKLHPALTSAWSKMYGWTSDADGIRHGSIEAPEADQSLARYVLVTCSAFVSHLIEVARKAKLI